MTTISLNATETLRDLMPGLEAPRKAPRKAPRPALTEVAATVPEATEPLGLRLLPRAWREALIHRARQRELDEAFERLAETSAHLLADVGLAEAPKLVEPEVHMNWTRALPAPGASPARVLGRPPGRGALSRSRRQLAELDERLLADVGLDRTWAQQEVRRPVWDAPSFWLR